MKQFILVLRGPSGSGKTSLSKKIQETIGSKVAHLKADYFYWKVCPQDTNKHIDENPIVYENLADLTENYIKDGYSVIIEGLLNQIDKFDLDLFLKKNSIENNINYLRIFLNVDLETARIRHSQSDFSVPIEEVEGWKEGRPMNISEKDIQIDTQDIDTDHLTEKVISMLN